MSYYHECSACGSCLDPGEKCDCEKEERRMSENDKLRQMRKTAEKPKEHGAWIRPRMLGKVKAGIRKERTDATANRSDYTFHINSKHGKQVLVIEDLDRGGMSVTNNIEAVLAEIEDEIGTSIYQMPIIYRDSDGRYDGINGQNLRRNPLRYRAGEEKTRSRPQSKGAQRNDKHHQG